jgi:hypothetical protein
MVFLENDLPNFQQKNLRFMLGGSYGYECTFNMNAHLRVNMYIRKK